jgi:photosystem II stability/assembly factor-like uncharacterized protein
MKRTAAFSQLDPVDVQEVERVSSSPVFEDLRSDIVATPHGLQGSFDDDADSLGLHHRPRHLRPVAVFGVVCVVAVVVGALVFSSGRTAPNGPTTTQRQAGRAISGEQLRGAAHVLTGTWTLVDDALSGTWRQSTTGGPPPGDLSCPGPSTCYAMSGRYASPKEGSPLLSESLYVSTDMGASWTQLPMPEGFAPTSPLACGGMTDCAAGGIENGQSVLVTTNDGGHTFASTPLPAAVGHLDTLSCPSPTFCAGLAAPSGFLEIGKTDATFLSTSDGGKTFRNSPIVSGDSMQSLVCSSSSDCTAVGWSDALGSNDPTAGVAAKTTDGGQHWSAGTLPTGFGISYLTQLSCPDASHCSVTGLISIAVQNPPQCGSIPQRPEPSESTTTTSLITPSAAVQRIAQTESAAASSANQKVTNGFSCNPSGQLLIGDIASTTNGGLSWRPDPLPADVPQPQFSGLSCPADNQCWATGSEAVPVQIGNTFDAGSSMVLGTTDGGSTWSRVTFSVPAGAPNYDGQSYLSIGAIKCPSTGVCVALGVGAQSSPSVPTYSLTETSG